MNALGSGTVDPTSEVLNILAEGRCEASTANALLRLAQRVTKLAFTRAALKVQGPSHAQAH